MGINRLSGQQSSYLKQHKNNPVHWFPYGEEAIQLAKKSDLPIFLSIGYSSCHWCHVMAHESFEDQSIADFLNANFICIKVDKEEFPDIDHYYQEACQLFTKSGGWPLSAFLLPDTRPFFVGTYFPKIASHGMPSFLDVITEISKLYKNGRETALENATKVTEAILKNDTNKTKVQFDGHFPQPSSILHALESYQDKENGGYGGAPKFPSFAFNLWATEQMLEGMVDRENGKHIIETIEKMMTGGIFDHLKGGIHRYSTDEKWLVPHFEKMLYDQAGLLSLLAKASNINQSVVLLDALMTTLQYLSTEILSEKGYFFSAQDADSDGIEGYFFTFSEDEFTEALISKDSEDELFAKNMDHLKKCFNITSEGNFHSGLSVISLNLKAISEMKSEEEWMLIRKAKEVLLKTRQERTPPATDTKGVAGWNFMLLTALADVIQYNRIPLIKEFADKLFNHAINGIYKNFLSTSTDGKMTIRHSTSRENSHPYFEDYVFFAESQLRAYEITANNVFKENFLESMRFLKSEFMTPEGFLTRAKTSNEKEPYPNQLFSPFDSSYRSAATTYILLLERGSTLLLDSSFIQPFNEIIENIKHDVLKNPLAGGEALRALTYPKEAFKHLKVPRTWVNNETFTNFRPYFMPRFVISYHDDANETWQICSLTACEKSGEGVENFAKSLTPKS